MGFDALLGNDRLKQNLTRSLVQRACFPLLPDLRAGGLGQAYFGKAARGGDPLSGQLISPAAAAPPAAR